MTKNVKQTASAGSARAHPEGVPPDLQVVSGLRVDPEEVGRADVARQTQSRVCGDAALPVHDLVAPPWWNAYGDRDPVLGETERLDELLQEHLARVDRENLVHLHHLPVVVHDLDVLDVRFGPPEADPPLLVDPDAVLPDAVALECLQSVTRWHSQVVEHDGCVDHHELPQRHSVDPGIDRPGTLPPPQPLSLSVPE